MAMDKIYHGQIKLGLIQRGAHGSYYIAGTF